MTATDAIIHSIDLSARSVDLLNTVLTSSGPVGALIELGEWLRIEWVPKNALARCLSQARGLAYANQTGVAFYERILNAPPVTEAWPLALKQSGALGRRLIQDPYLDWMVSTTAVLMQFHNDTFVSQALCMMIMRQQNETAENKMASFELRYVAERIEIKAVIDKLVTSVWYNVVNSGNQTDELPDVLKNVCLRGHHLNPDQFGELTHALKAHRGKVIVESKHLLGNLTLWLLLHFHGVLSVTVSGKVLFEKTLEKDAEVPAPTIELKVQTFCDRKHDCSKEEDVYRLYDVFEGSFEEFVSGTYPSTSDQAPKPAVRAALYDVRKSYDGRWSMLSDAVLADARRRSQLFVRWLLELPVTTQQDSADFNFSVRVLEPAASSGSFRLGSLLGQSPAILNFNWGSDYEDTIIFAPPDVDPTEESDNGATAQTEGLDWEDISNMSLDFEEREGLGPVTAQDTEEDLLAYFPLLRDLVRKTKQACRCSDCQGSRRLGDESGNEMGSSTLPPGCNSQYAVWFILLLISHAIAESFGAHNSSGNRNPRHILRGITKLLFEVVRDGEVRWDTWFNLAACVDLGCPFQDTVMDIESGGTSYAALQFGNLAVMAPWLDVTTEQDVHHCFRYVRSEGVIGVLHGEEGAEQYYGIQDRFAILQTEHTEDTASYAQRFQKVAEPLTTGLKVKPDDTICQLEIVIVAASEKVYRLLMRYISDTTRRIVDPVDGMIKLARLFHEVECEHSSKWGHATEIKEVVKYYTFDDLLGHWQNEDMFYGPNKAGPPAHYHGRHEEQAPGLIFHVSSLLDASAKVNAARALLVNSLAVINMGKCCMPCAIDKARTMPMPKDIGLDSEVPDRYILNVGRRERQLVRSGKRKAA